MSSVSNPLFEKISKYLLMIAIFLIAAICINFIFGPRVVMSEAVKNKLNNTIYLTTKDGLVVIEMIPDIAPNHVARIKQLCKKKFYDGSKFHRVIDGFMAQTGDNPEGIVEIVPTLNAEFSKLPHRRGAVSMARANDVNSATSQFFIVTDDSQFLDGNYTIWGYVTSGMEYIDKVKKGSHAKNGAVDMPDKIISMRVASDVEEAIAMNNK